MDNKHLAELVREKYILSTMRHYPSTLPISEPDLSSAASNEVDPGIGRAGQSPGNGGTKIVVEQCVSEEFHRLMMFFTDIILGVKRGLERNNVCIEYLQFILEEHCDLRPLPPEVATIERIFARLHPHYCKFERLARLVFHKVYRRVAHLRVTEGCVQACWTVPNVTDIRFQLSHLVRLPNFMDGIGVLSLTVGDSVIFEQTLDEDHES